MFLSLRRIATVPRITTSALPRFVKTGFVRTRVGEPTAGRPTGAVWLTTWGSCFPKPPILLFPPAECCWKRFIQQIAILLEEFDPKSSQKVPDRTSKMRHSITHTHIHIHTTHKRSASVKSYKLQVLGRFGDVFLGGGILDA